MGLRREISLPPSDVTFLDSVHPGWEVIREGATSWLLLPSFPLCAGYTMETTTVALQLEPGYPDTQIDMVYFHPDLVRQDGQNIGATEARQSIDGRTFQRWSRHRTAENPWRPGEDDVQTHVLLIKHWLEREFTK